MKRFAFILFCFTTLILPTVVGAETRSVEFALFKKMITPVYKFGENGIITVPKAIPTGQGNVYYAANGQEAGKIQGDQLYMVTESLMIGSSNDVELGITKREFVWETAERSDIEMDSYHFKARAFHIDDDFWPQVAIGVNAVSLKNSSPEGENETLLNPFLAVTMNIPFADEYAMSISWVVEHVEVNGQTTQRFYSGGVDLKLADMFFFMAEAHGLNKEDEDPMVNVGAKLKYGWFHLGVVGFNVNQGNIVENADEYAEEEDDSTDEIKTMYHFAFQIPFGELF